MFQSYAMDVNIFLEESRCSIPAATCAANDAACGALKDLAETSTEKWCMPQRKSCCSPMTLPGRMMRSHPIASRPEKSKCFIM